MAHGIAQVSAGIGVSCGGLQRGLESRAVNSGVFSHFHEKDRRAGILTEGKARCFRIVGIGQQLPQDFPPLHGAFFCKGALQRGPDIGGQRAGNGKNQSFDGLTQTFGGYYAHGEIFI